MTDPAGAPESDTVPSRPSLRYRVRELYFGDSRAAAKFRYILLAFDIIVIGFVIISSFFRGEPLIFSLDYLFGVLILIDFSARLYSSERRIKNLLNPVSIADLIVIASLLAPAFGHNFGFLRIARTLRLFRSYQLIDRLGDDFPLIKRNKSIVFSSINMLIFLLVMTAIVFETQVDINSEIQNYADALYFTATTLSTTGYGDITLEGTWGRLLSVLIMIFGVSLFLRLAQTVFRPSKVEAACRTCGLTRHDADAVHCKHCGAVIKIRTEGEG